MTAVMVIVLKVHHMYAAERPFQPSILVISLKWTGQTSAERPFQRSILVISLKWTGQTSAERPIIPSAQEATKALVVWQLQGDL